MHPQACIMTKAVVFTCAAMLAVGLSSCIAGENPSASRAHSVAGWYVEHAGQRTIQSCGQSQTWRVTVASDLPARARKFGLGRDTPVYVKLLATARGNEIAVSRVEQLGSPTPIRNCGLSGVVLPAQSADH